MMGSGDENRPEGPVGARRGIEPGDGHDDDVSGHGMPEVPSAGGGFMAVPRLPRRDGLAGDTGDDVEGHAFALRRSVGQADDDGTGSGSGETGEASTD
jgi:hypothetical protein